MVRCNICHALFNERYLASHKRLAHDQRGQGNARPASEKEAILEIVKRFEALPPRSRRKVLDMLEMRVGPHEE
ncbi:MAG TPA: hypothetical protein VMJ93_05525 [Verrucomicrobiae bacterium]|nr:hypothetical protein [Verrucomicrobiae bacterium]